MSFNKIILVGRVTRDPELRYTPNGKPVAQFGLAVNRPRTAGGQEETDFFDIVVWQKTAEFASKYATKGRLVAIDGRVQIREFVDKDGMKRKAWEVVANDLRLLDSGRDRQAAPEAGYDSGRDRQAAPEAGYESAAPTREPVYSGGAPTFESGPADMGIDDIPF